MDGAEETAAETIGEEIAKPVLHGALTGIFLTIADFMQEHKVAIVVIGIAASVYLALHIRHHRKRRDHRRRARVKHGFIVAHRL